MISRDTRAYGENHRSFCSREASHRSAYDKQILRGGKNVIETNDLDPEPEGQNRNRNFKIMKTNNEAGPQISENSPALWTVIYEFHYHGLNNNTINK